MNAAQLRAGHEESPITSRLSVLCARVARSLSLYANGSTQHSLSMSWGRCATNSWCGTFDQWHGSSWSYWGPTTALRSSL